MTEAMPYRELAEIGRGGMATVYRSQHATTGDVVALKRPMPWDGCDERLRRESDVLSKIDAPNVMPILAAGEDEDRKPWYAMPIAKGSLKGMHTNSKILLDSDSLCRMVLTDVGRGLIALHKAGFVHRDVAPGNVLALPDSSRKLGYRWVLSDLGLVRRPHGDTTHNLTGSASLLGTLGYIAPEVHGDPHGATAAADIYSLGRVLAWLLTGKTPVLTEPLLPEGVWRGVIREFTHRDPARRPQSIVDAVERADELLVDLPISTQAEFHVAIQAKSRSLAPSDPLWDVALENLADDYFVLDELVEVDETSARAFAEQRPADAARAAEQMAQHMVTGDWGRRNFDFANRHLDWVLAVLKGLLQEGELGLFEDVAAAYVDAVAAWNRFPHNGRLDTWLRGLPEPAGAAVARAIRQAGVTDFFKGTFGRGQDFSSATLGTMVRS